MRILIATHRIGWRSGSETHTRDLAGGLVARGHDCAIYAPGLREDKDVRALRAAGVTVTDRLSRLPWEPDTIHGHHRWETLRACARFPRTPALQVCHDATNRRDLAGPRSLIQMRCGVDDFCRERVARETGLPPDDIRLLPNAVDLRAFGPRRAPPATPPRRALIFHSIADQRTDFAPVAEACRSLGIALERIGPGRFTETPWEALAAADLVFAKARCALEAMACGCHVILAGHHGLGPTLAPASFAAMRRRNFGRSLLSGPLTAGRVAALIAALDGAATAEICRLTRETCGIATLAETAEELHRELLASGPVRRGWRGRAWGALAWARTEYCRLRGRPSAG